MTENIRLKKDIYLDAQVLGILAKTCKEDERAWRGGIDYCLKHEIAPRKKCINDMILVCRKQKKALKYNLHRSKDRQEADKLKSEIDALDKTIEQYLLQDRGCDYITLELMRVASKLETGKGAGKLRRAIEQFMI